MMEGPKMIWIGADWKAERDHYGLDNRCGMFSTERFHEDDKGYVPADLTDALVEASEEVIKSATGAYSEKRTNVSKDKFNKLQAALAAYRGEK